MASMQKINEQALSFFEELEQMEEDESFKIDDDNKAEWALERIRELTDDANRLLKIIAAKREELEDNARFEERDAKRKDLGV